MNPFAEKAYETLKLEKYRLTQPRRSVIQILAAAESPLSASEIKTLLDEQNASVDAVSVYRILDCLKQLHLVHQVQHSGKYVKCQVNHDDCAEPEHCHDEIHQVFICDQCETTQEVPAPELRQTLQKLA